MTETLTEMYDRLAVPSFIREEMTRSIEALIADAVEAETRRIEHIVSARLAGRKAP